MTATPPQGSGGSGGIDISGAGIGDMIYYDGVDWVALAISTNGKILKIVAGIPSWQDAPSAEVTALTDLSDVTITTPSTGQVVRYNGSAWVNATLAAGDLPANIVYNNQANTYSGGGTQDFGGAILDNVTAITTNAANPATSGAIRLGNNEAITVRNAANTTNIQILKLTSADHIEIGANNVNSILFQFGLIEYDFNETFVDWKANNLLNVTFYESAAATPASSGAIRLGNTELVSWRNAGNTNNDSIRFQNSEFGILVSGVVQYSFSSIEFDCNGNNIVDVGTVDALRYEDRSTTNIATTGTIRLGNNKEIAWRNVNNTANLVLTADIDNILKFNTVPISLEGHTHVKADITDFAHTHVKADITDFAHTHVKADITDFAHTHVKADITDFTHQSSHQSGGGDALTGLLDATARVAVRKNTGGADVGARRRLNFIEGSNVTLTIADDGAGEEVDITIAASGGGLADGDKGDITVSGSGATWTIDNDVVTFGKMQNIATDRLLGRDTAASGDIEELTVGGGIEFTGAGGIQTSAFTGDVTKSAGGTALTIPDNTVTYAKMQDVTATSRFIGRITAGAGDPEELTAANAKTILALVMADISDLSPSTIVRNNQANTYTGGGTQDFAGAILDNVATLISSTTTPATSGTIRLGNSQSIQWRNASNTANDSVAFSTSSFNISISGALSYSFDANEADFFDNRLIGVQSIESGQVNPSVAGFLKLANNEEINWRNAANSADLGFKTNASNELEFTGSLIFDATAITNHTTLATADPAADYLLIHDATDGLVKKILPEDLGVGGGGVSDGDKGDITVSGTGATWTIDNDVVTFAKMQNVAQDRVLGRISSGSGDTEELTGSDVATLTGIVTRINGSSGAAGSFMTWQNLTANSSDVTTTGLSSSVMTTTGVGSGTWKFKYTLVYQTAATGTGIAFGVNHTGTATMLQAMWYNVTTGGTAATGVGDNDAATVAGQLVEGKTEAVLNTIIGSASAGSGAANANIIAVLEGILVVTASGDIELKIATEVASSAVRIMANSCLELIKIE